MSLAQHLLYACSQSCQLEPRCHLKAWLGSCGVRYCSDHTQVFVRIQSLPGRLLGASLNCMWASLVVPYALVPTSPFLLQKILFMISSVHILACTSKTRVRLKKKKQNSYNTIIYPEKWVINDALNLSNVPSLLKFGISFELKLCWL